ncbi:hypothetical protein ONZ51_g7084 [Trametes cubensis]|uniref:Uncharacterized protein n=1 Tax=Trametes cubensis TaxID=1111947 RepID=A0AAD7XAI3_9APHY|nr:hypothetical protein ONZ51_g7084 [Trametes cubensis]
MAVADSTTTGRHGYIHDSEYGKSSKELIEFVGQLRALGAHIDLELPRIVVIGNQSAGKSSLVEAISGISVPRDAGTYAWTCQIKIRYEYDENGKQLDEVAEVDFGPLITEKTRVEDMLRRAQAAVLRPDLDPATFLGSEPGHQLPGKKPLKFSKNVVCVELAGPDLADLSFVDLPGIVQNADDETVQLVEDMVTSHIKGNSLILVTLPMSDDIENQKAARLARQADPQGLRTIGVMTKPDTLTAGSTKARQMWLDVLEGRRHPLLHGYYCTRQPDDDERIHGVSGAAARQLEAAFFSTTSPWANANCQDRLGTTNLVKNISKLLTQIILASQLETCTAQLEKLPPPVTTEPSAFVLALVTNFSSELSARIHGGIGADGSVGKGSKLAIVQSTRRIYESFKVAIRSTAPPFAPYPNATSAPDHLRRKGTGVMYLEDLRRHIRTSVTRELPGNVPYTAKVSLIRACQENWEDAVMGCFEAVQLVFKDAIGELVRPFFDRYNVLKGTVGPVIMELGSICAEQTIERIRFVLSLETSPFTQNGHYLSDGREKWLGIYKDIRAGKSDAEAITAGARPAAQRPLPAPATIETLSTEAVAPDVLPLTNNNGKREAETASDAQRKSKKMKRQEREAANKEQTQVAQANARVGATSNPNTGTPSTENEIRNVVHGIPDPRQVEDNEKEVLLNEALAVLAKLGYTGLTEEDLGKLNKTDEYDEELHLMAEVRAYFQVAYKRVIDYVPLAIDHSFLYAFSERLRERLFERLGLGGANASERCTGYIAEDPGIVAQRDELTSKKKRLENVQRALFNFGL